MSYVLIVDDNLDARIIVREILQAAGHEVGQAGDGQEALKRSIERRPDLVLMDVSMPKMSGPDAVKRIKQRWPALPIIAFTAHAMKGDARKALEAGYDDYIAKPCAPKEILKKIEDWLLRARTRRADEKKSTPSPREAFGQ